MRPAILLDRDGTIIEEAEYLDSIDNLRLLPGAGEALKALSDAGYALAVVTNQSGVARGYFDLAKVAELNGELSRRLAACGVEIGYWGVCPHHPEFTGPCGCRKPEPGMLLDAAKALGAGLAGSWMVGDKADDVEAGRRAGCRTALVLSGHGEKELEKLRARGVKPDLVTERLESFAAHLLAARKD